MYSKQYSIVPTYGLHNTFYKAVTHLQCKENTNRNENGKLLVYTTLCIHYSFINAVACVLLFFSTLDINLPRRHINICMLMVNIILVVSFCKADAGKLLPVFF